MLRVRKLLSELVNVISFFRSLVFELGSQMSNFFLQLKGLDFDLLVGKKKSYKKEKKRKEITSFCIISIEDWKFSD